MGAQHWKQCGVNSHAEGMAWGNDKEMGNTLNKNVVETLLDQTVLLKR